MSILAIQNLSLQVDNKPLLKSINFEIKKGEIFALVGESGSGKSLTSLAIMRLLPEVIKVTEGEIMLNGTPLFTLPEYQMQKVRGRSIAMIFQEPMTALNPVMRVGEQVAEVICLHLGLKKEEAKERVIELFNEVAIKEPKERYDWYPHQLSGGQKQRVMIAMALACEPDLLIADEPTTALDVTIQAQVLALLKEIQKKRKLSILFITHDMGVVAQMADRIAVMRQGEILEMDKKEEFFSKPKHPYTKRLLQDTMNLHNKCVPTQKQQRLLEVKGLKVYFPIKKGVFQRTVGYVKAVDGVDFSIDRGKSLALVGESGSGKSTIGQAIVRLVENIEGSIKFDNQEITTLSNRAFMPYRGKIQTIFQDPYASLNPRMSIGSIISEGMDALGVGKHSRAEQEQNIKELLLKVGLKAEHFYRYPHEFSGGQRQRIAIARALAVEPELIICDEPTSALDVSVRSQVLKLLRKLQEEFGISYLFITHDLSIIDAVADDVAVMKEGRLVEVGSVDEVMNNPYHEYTKKLLSSAPKLPKQNI